MADEEPSPEPADSPTKTCTKCGETKPETAFYLKNAAKSPSLRATVCKDCDNMRKRLNLENNRAEINQQRRERRALHRAERNAQARAWWTKNTDHVNAQRRAQRAANPAPIRQRERAYRDANKEKIRAQDRAHYARTKEQHRARARTRYHANPQFYQAQQRQKRLADPTRYRRYETTKRARHRDKLLIRAKTRWYAFRDRLIAQKRARYAENRQELAERGRVANRRWRATHPQEYAASRQRRGIRRRAYVRGLPATFTEEDRQFCYQYFGYACVVCGHEQGFEWGLSLDHWVAITDPACPGTVPENIVPLCSGVGGCNNSKNNRKAEEWLEQRFGKRKAKAILKRIETYFAIARERQEHATYLETGD